MRAGRIWFSVVVLREAPSMRDLVGRWFEAHPHVPWRCIAKRKRVSVVKRFQRTIVRQICVVRTVSGFHSGNVLDYKFRGAMNTNHELEQEIVRAIEAARQACSEPLWNDWAERWLSEQDRTAESAHRAARDARVASGRPNAEDLDEHEEFASQARTGLGFHSGLYLDVAQMEQVKAQHRVVEVLVADEEAERTKRTMTAAELAAHAAALAVGAMRGSEFVAERIGPLAIRHARTAQRLVQSS